MKRYERPALRRFGSLSVLTMGMNGSCPDGGSPAPINDNQKGCGNTPGSG